MYPIQFLPSFSYAEITKISQTYRQSTYYLGMVSVVSILKIDCTKRICRTHLCVVLHRPFSTIALWTSLINRPAAFYSWVLSNQPSTATPHIKNTDIILYQTHLHAILHVNSPNNFLQRKILQLSHMECSKINCVEKNCNNSKITLNYILIKFSWV